MLTSHIWALAAQQRTDIFRRAAARPENRRLAAPLLRQVLIPGTPAVKGGSTESNGQDARVACGSAAISSMWMVRACDLILHVKEVGARSKRSAHRRAGLGVAAAR
jgi:hypothetical protein